jgi:hypothetical protein
MNSGTDVTIKKKHLSEKFGERIGLRIGEIVCAKIESYH